MQDSKPQGPPPSYPMNPGNATVDPRADSAYGYGEVPPSYSNQPILIQPVPVEPYVDVPDYLALSIISILFCTCFGIYSIVKASNARQSKAAGKYSTAREESTMAKKSAIAGIVVGTILTIIIIAIRIAGAN